MDDQVSLLLDAIATPLARLLSLDVDHISGDCAQLTLNVALIRGAGAPRKIATSLQPALRALARLLNASYHLQRSSTQKAQLWSRVVQDGRLFVNGDTVCTAARALPDCALGDVRFPHIVLDFSRIKVSHELADTLADFFLDNTGGAIAISNSSSNDSTAYEHTAALRPVKVGLRFTRCQLRAQELLLLEYLLQRVAGNGMTRALHINSLDVSDNGLSTPELLVLATVLKRRDGYGLDELVLANTLSSHLANDALKGFRAVIDAAFDVGTNVRTATLTASPLSGLARFDLQANALGAAAFATVCSAFRYSRAVQSLSLARTLSVINPAEREQCWRWLAFGAFHIRGGAQPGGIVRRQLDLSGNALFPNDVEVLRRVLVHPATELLAHSGDADAAMSISNDDTVTPTTLGMCRVAEGSTLYVTPTLSAASIIVLDHQTELESLGALAAEWVCVVVPGFGLGWAFAARVEHIDPGARSSHDPEPCVLYDLVLNRMVESESTTLALVALLETIGKQLCALELRHYRALDAQLLATIVMHCPRLERLDLEDCSLTDAMMDAFINALHGELGGRLLALNVSSNYLGAGFAARLAAVLAHVERAPALLELRLYNCSLGDLGLTSLRDALAVNKTLATLELGPLRDASALERIDSVEWSLNSAFQGERLPVDAPLPLAHRLAFLSTTVAESGAKSALDTYMLTTILHFAGAQVHRRIHWQR